MEIVKAQEMVERGAYHPRFFVLGESGAGKTTALTTFPPSWKVLVLDFFGNKESLVGCENVEIISYGDLDPKTPEAWIEMEKDRRELIRRLETGKFEWDVVAIDTLTGLMRYCMNFVLMTNPDHKGIGGQPARTHYGATSQLTGDYLLSFLAFPITIVLNAHVDLKRNELTGSVRYLPMTIGSMWRSTLASYFGEVYRAFGEASLENSEKTEFFWQTQPDREWPMLKSVLNQNQSFFGKYIEPNYEELFRRRGLLREGGEK